jgi:hypothetical protein
MFYLTFSLRRQAFSCQRQAAGTAVDFSGNIIIARTGDWMPR